MRLEPDFPMYGAGASTCYLCGGGPNGLPVLDTERDIFQEGRLGICGQCVADAASLYGFVTPETAERLKAKAAKAEDRAKQAEGRLEAVKAEMLQVVA